MFRKTGKMQKIPVPLQRTVLVHVCASTGDPELCQTLSRGKSETTLNNEGSGWCSVWTGWMQGSQQGTAHLQHQQARWLQCRCKPQQLWAARWGDKGCGWGFQVNKKGKKHNICSKARGGNTQINIISIGSALGRAFCLCTKEHHARLLLWAGL